MVTSGIFRSAGAQSFGGAHRGRVCVRVFIGCECACVLWASSLYCVILKNTVNACFTDTPDPHQLAVNAILPAHAALAHCVTDKWTRTALLPATFPQIPPPLLISLRGTKSYSKPYSASRSQPLTAMPHRVSTLLLLTLAAPPASRRRRMQSPTAGRRSPMRAGTRGRRRPAARRRGRARAAPAAGR